MNKLQHLKACKQYLRKVRNMRRFIDSKNKGKKTTLEMQKTLLEIDYYLGTINNFDNMLRWISRSDIQNNIRELIPSNKESWKTELRNLINEGNVLAGKMARQREFSF